MTTIHRKQFIEELSSGGINVNDLSSETEAQLTQLGISADDLKKIAGKDGRISGEAELNKLFTLVDNFDRDGSADSISVMGENEIGVQTKSSALYEALKAEIDRNRAKAHTQGVIHLGMRKASGKEADALEKSNPKLSGGVVRIEAFNADGIASYDGKSMDLKTDSGLAAFRDALSAGPDKMPKDQAQKLVDFLKTQENGARDELAQLGLAFFRAGNDDLPVNRLILSGHGLPGGVILGEDNPGFLVDDLKTLVDIFPKGAEKIEHVAISACFCAGVHMFNVLRDAFPNLKSALAYNESSPEAEKGAPRHLQKWESMTDGDDPSQVDPVLAGTASWNIVDGVQGLPKLSLTQAEKAVKELEFTYEYYKTGEKKPAEGIHDRDLFQYYARLADLVRHPDISPQRRLEVDARIKEVLRLRHPELPAVR